MDFAKNSGAFLVELHSSVPPDPPKKHLTKLIKSPKSEAFKILFTYYLFFCSVRVLNTIVASRKDHFHEENDEDVGAYQ
jgi:hypothetical protein